MKHYFFTLLFLFLFHFGVEAQSNLQNISIAPISEGMGIVEKYNVSEKASVKNFKKKVKEIKKLNLISDKLQKRIALEDATTISNTNFPNFQKAEVIETAKQYIGTPYHYGGMSKKGIDCSALMLFAYTKNDMELPRTSRAQSKIGRKVNKAKAEPGDLIFFKTNRRRSIITHVGLVTENIDGQIKFIHASSSKGVIESSLAESYYQKTFAKIKRIIE
ncbi:C40 family peptidase [uncultured Flavobacterium sp.]|uniref:C40 family peptidase n=1 Tax=uncultured Flavobacterium sp. TaxID=165435 RepID=UPI0030EC422D